jgi:hypothetical protein
VPLLVELAVVRQIALWHHPQHLPAVQHHGAIEQGMAGTQRCSDDDDRRDLARCLRQLGQCREHAVKKRVLEEEVLVGIARQGQFRKNDEGSMVLGGRLYKLEHLPAVIARIGNPHARRGNGRSNEPVGIG